MPSQFNNSRADTSGLSAQDTSSTSVPASDGVRDLHRVAVLVANGEMPLPDDLPPPDHRWLLEEVGRQRRARLIRFIARAIALDIHGSREP